MALFSRLAQGGRRLSEDNEASWAPQTTTVACRQERLLANALIDAALGQGWSYGLPAIFDFMPEAADPRAVDAFSKALGSVRSLYGLRLEASAGDGCGPVRFVLSSRDTANKKVWQPLTTFYANPDCTDTQTGASCRMGLVVSESDQCVPVKPEDAAHRGILNAAGLFLPSVLEVLAANGQS